MKLNSVIGFDYGLKFIGVAIGHTVTKAAYPLGVVTYKNNILERLEKIFFYWKPHLIVVGLPLNMDGSIQNITSKSELFAYNIAKYFKLPYEFQDERLTTYEAKSFFINKFYIKKKILITTNRYLNKLKYKKKDIKFYIGKYDAISASIILGNWLNRTK